MTDALPTFRTLKMSKTISGYHDTLQVLGTTNPSVIVSGSFSSTLPPLAHGYAAIYGPAAGDFTITNSGLIDDTNTSFANVNAGIVLGGVGSVDNIGTILALGVEGEGIYMYAGGSVTNSGTIIGQRSGIFTDNLTKTADFVENTGFIEATTKNYPFTENGNTYIGSGTGIFVVGGSGSTIKNAAGATVEAQYGTGIDLIAIQPNYLLNIETPVSGGLVNAGTVKAAYGVVFYALGTVSNSGKILATKLGAIIDTTANVVNTGTITGDIGIRALQTATIDNTGSIGGTGPAAFTILSATGSLETLASAGILLSDGGTISNGASGIISGAAAYGIDLTLGGSVANIGRISGKDAGILSLGEVFVTNSGAIEATGTRFVTGGVTHISAAIQIDDGGQLINQAGGIISGNIGVSANADTTLINAGTITGSGGEAVYLFGRNDIVIDDPGAVFNGVVDDNLNTGILELAAGATTGTISSFGSEFLGFPTVSVDTGATWDIGGAIGNLLDDGLVNIVSGASLDISAAVNPASIGTFELTSKGSLEIASLLGTNVKIKFLGTTPANKLTIDSAANFGLHVGTSSYKGPLLEDFKAGDVIDLKGIASTGLKLSYSTTTGDLQITASGGGVVATLEFQNASLGAGRFHTATDNAGGTLLTHS